MSGRDPEWLHDAWRAISGEVREFVATAWLVTIAPRRFAADWSDGKVHTLNPLMFVLNGLATLGVWQASWNRAFHRASPDRPLWLELSRPVWPLLLTLGWTAVAHLFIRALGGRRPLRSSLAMAFFTGGGPLALISLFLTPFGTLFAARAQPTIAMALLALVILVIVLVALIVYPTLALAGVHRVAGWRIAVGVVVATIAELALIVWLVARHTSWVALLSAG